jgi:hypothetical protein
VVLAAGAVLVVGILSAAALAIEEEEYYSSILHAEAAAQAILGALHKKHPRLEGGDHPRTRRYICWDRNRAKKCIEQDYLGVTPSFGTPTDAKRVEALHHKKHGIRGMLCLW